MSFGTKVFLFGDHSSSDAIANMRQDKPALAEEVESKVMDAAFSQAFRNAMSLGAEEFEKAEKKACQKFEAQIAISSQELARLGELKNTARSPSEIQTIETQEQVQHQILNLLLQQQKKAIAEAQQIAYEKVLPQMQKIGQDTSAKVARKIEKIHKGCSALNCQTNPLEASLKKCGKCQEALYCSPECQRADWPMHKKTCIKK